MELLIFPLNLPFRESHYEKVLHRKQTIKMIKQNKADNIYRDLNTSSAAFYNWQSNFQGQRSTKLNVCEGLKARTTKSKICLLKKYLKTKYLRILSKKGMESADRKPITIQSKHTSLANMWSHRHQSNSISLSSQKIVNNKTLYLQFKLLISKYSHYGCLLLHNPLVQQTLKIWTIPTHY